MKILWSTNIPMPIASEMMGLKSKVTGGWLVASYKALSKVEGIELAIAFPQYGIKELKKYSEGNITHYAVPQKKPLKYDVSMERHFKELLDKVKPDVVHIHGTERPYNYLLTKICGQIPVIVSIQGLLSSCERQYYAGMEFKDVFFKPTLRDLLKLNTIPIERHNFKKRAIIETTLLKSVRYVIGRTPFDYANIKAINPEIHYFHCDEALRQSFYQNAFDIDKMNRHTIFVSQGYYPLKGFHMVLKAAALLKNDFPDLKIVVTGYNVYGNTVKQKLKITGYGMYIKKLIQKLNLEKNIEFAGLLSEQQMAEVMVKSNVFVLPSSVENSSNSLAEAMLMGVPCVAAYTGGTPHMLEEGKCGLLYPFMEYPMLAENIRSFFNDDALAMQYSQRARMTAVVRHDRDMITSKTVEIYNQIIKADIT